MVIALLAGCIPGISLLRDECGDDTGEERHVWTGDACGNSAQAPVLPRVFASSLSTDGNLAAYADSNGLAGGDGICRDAAAAGELPGTFRAYLSTPAVDAIDRITSEGPWYQVGKDRQPAFANHAALGTAVDVGYLTDEYGEFFSGSDAIWTGSTQAGRRDSDDHCDAWSSRRSDVRGAVFDESFQATSWQDCGYHAHVLCFQIE